MGESLTEAILTFKRSGQGLDEIVKQIGIEVYSFPRRKLGWDEDDCSEFFCYFYPKLPRLVGRFRYTGKPFEAFLAVTLKWQLKTFAARKNQELLRSRVLAREGFVGEEHTYCLPEDPADDARAEVRPPLLTEEARKALKVEEDGTIADRCICRRLLFLVLQSCLSLPSLFTDEIARMIRCDAAWLYEKIEEIRSRTEERRARVSCLKEKRNNHFFKIYCLQEQLSLVCELEVKRELVRQMVREKRRLLDTIGEISRVPLCPTHCDIAEVLGVPKGSVDSGLYYLKDSLRCLLPKEESEYA